MFGKLVTADVQARTMQDKVKKLKSPNSLHFGEQQILSLLKWVKYPKTRVFKIFQWQCNTVSWKNRIFRLWKKSWNLKSSKDRSTYPALKFLLCLWRLNKNSSLKAGCLNLVSFSMDHELNHFIWLIFIAHSFLRELFWIE